MGVKITSWGHFIPQTSLTNSELSKRFNVTTDWILERTGIEERKYFSDGATSDMIVKAALSCLQQTNLSATDIDCIIVATMTPDHYCPSTATFVHQKLGTNNAWGFDLMAACSGYLYALQLATSLINSNSYKTVLVCGADKMSSCIDPSDRKTVLVLADGAGVSLLQQSSNDNDIVDTICKLDSSHSSDITMIASGSKVPSTIENISQGKHYLRFERKTIFDTAISLMLSVAEEVLSKNRLKFEDIDFIVPHQANKRIIETLAKKFDLPIEKFIINVEQIGNTSAATIPIAISQALEDKKLKGNEKLLLVSVGAGYTYSASLINLNHV
ncbi:3-oxoacyl-ACP synthase III family protein [Arundinibacter roseus]|uniref:3-oxoacyl-ACP synthase III family protein n=1 Tax=Arundinibacter roseus TaxID=2070510 RepID=UPI001404509A|nr:beta-ketoacyl-ACP synthase III [Arundinibacter roseus]